MSNDNQGIATLQLNTYGFVPLHLAVPDPIVLVR